jgi:gliding motility-associated-like protein
MAVALQAAGQRYEIDRVCVGAERYYRLDGEVGSTYAWLLTDPFGAVTTLPETVDTVTILWNVPAGIYSLTNLQYGVNGCDTTQLGTITVFDLPEAFAGNSLTLCAPEPVILNLADAENYSSLLWTTSGDGAFDDEFALNPTYTLGPNDIVLGSVTLTLTANGLGNEGSCPPAVSSLTITLNNLLADVILTPASCYGEPDGTATLTASGGTEPYTFTLDGNTNATGVFTGLAANTYTYIISDAAGCEITGELTIDSPALITATVTHTNANCHGSANGTIVITETSGGSGNYEYRINGGPWQNGAAFAGLAPGDYLVEVRDANAPDCIVSLGIITLTEPDLLAANFSYTDVTYFGDSDGTISFGNPTGGSGTYQYSINGIDWQDSPFFPNLPPGNFTIFIRDANAPDCIIEITTLEILEGLLAEVIVDHQVSCWGGSDGQATVTASYGLPPYTYLWDDPSVQTSPTATGLAAGTYLVTVTDADGTEITLSVTITQPEELIAIINPATAGLCINESLSLSGITSGGTGNVSYLWSGSATAYLNSTTIQNPEFVSGIAGLYDLVLTITDENGCTATSETAWITVDEQIIPAFNPVGPLCQNSTAPALPLTSDNGITGTWNPATINTATFGTTTYTFTPDAGQCALVVTMDIEVSEEITPIFAQIGPLCQNSIAPDLPLTSTNSITGTWNPATINTATFGITTYTFTPDAGQCALVVTMDIEVSEEFTPIFAQIGPLCQNSIAPDLPLISTNNITGTWNPATINTATFGTTTYTFTPDAGQCAVVVTMDIEVSEEITPIFAQIGPLCQNSIAPDLPLTSTNSITGTWNPATINTATFGTTNYTFTPDAGQCALVVTMDIEVSEEITPIFAQIGPLCQNSTPPALPLVSDNGINGVWSPATINTAVAGTTTYTFTPDDPAQCGISFTMDITTNSLIADITTTPVSCYGLADGTVTIVVSGGTEPYTYNLDGNTNLTGYFPGLSANIYTYLISDAEGCSISGEATVSQPDQLLVTVTGTNPTTVGGSDGTATAIVAGGTPPYTYLWDDPLAQTTVTATGLVQGTYMVTVTDANGCKAHENITLFDPGTPLAVTIVIDQHVSCFGLSDGETTANVIGGVPPYNYLWDDPLAQTTATATGLIAGTYTVTVTDSEGTSVFAVVIITEPEELIVVVTGTNPTLPGGNDGTATATVTGGTLPYTFHWDDPLAQTSQTATGLVQGTYHVTVTDARGCVTTGEVTLTDPTSDLQVFAVIDQQVSCFGFSDGQATATATGGVPPYTFLWSDGQTTPTATNLTAGTYTVTVNDSDGNSVFTSVTITQPAVLAATVAWTNETLPGANDGTITVSAPSGGSGNYEYSIDGINWQVSGIFTGLVPGLYPVYMRDANAIDCFILLQTIDILPVGSLSADVDFTNITCFGSNDGTITISNPQNGSGNYEYSINSGASWQNSGNYTGLTANTYVVMLRDEDDPANEVTLATVTITEPAILTATVTFTNETLPGANDGTITVSSPSGGSGVYEYSINGFIWQSSGVFTNLVPGFYQVYIRDANAPYCYINLITLEILEAGTITAEIASTNVTCFGGNDGTITITNPTGGSGNYQYSIDGGISWQNSGNYTGLIAGSYQVMLRDANDPANEVTLATIIISEPAMLAANVTFTNETFPGANDGTITVSAPSGGSGAYEYSIDGTNWQASGNFTGLTPGSYDVFIRDENATGCYMLLQTINILPAGLLSADVEFTNVTCYAGNDGTISITNPAGGSGNYEYSIDGGTTWQANGSYTDLFAGSYTLMIRDANEPSNIVMLATIVISQPDVLAANVTFTNETFPGANDGTISVSAPTGGSGAYEYSIDGTNWQASGNFTGLAPGSYEVFINDANATGCSNSLTTLEIIPGGSLTATVDHTNVTCFGGSDGTITITDPQNGSGNYEFSINGGTSWQNSGTYTGLSAGTYVVMLRDTDEPTHVVNLGTIIINEPAELSATVASTPASCAGMADGDIVFSVATGGSGDHEFSIDGGLTWQPGEEFLNLSAGTYQTWMRDADQTDCRVFTGEVVVSEPPAIIATAEPTATTCNLENGTIIVTASGGTGEPEFMIAGITGWQEENLFTGLAEGTYAIMVRDAEGCEITLTGIAVGSIGGPAIANIEVTNATNGQPNGSVNIVADSPALPLQYSLTNNGSDWQASPVFDNLAIGTYIAYVMDANGCIVSQEFTVLNTVAGEVEISADTVTYCLNLPVIIPVEARDFTDISSFIIELEFDPSIISFNGLTNVNGELENGTFSTSIIGNVLQIRYSIWDGSATVGIGQQLFALSFNALVAGNSDLTWNWLQCVIYSASNDSVPGIYVNGMAEILPAPAIWADGAGVYCEGDTLTLYSGSFDGQILNYEWTGPTGFKHNRQDWQLGQLGLNDDGEFQVIATNPELCSMSQSISVKVNPKPVIHIGYADTICLGQQVLLDAGSGFVSYLWHDGSTEQSQYTLEEGTYWVQVVDTNNCIAVDTVSLVPCNIELLIPNAFTPNGDGLNDTFKPVIRGWEPSSYFMKIYTKWGQLIFETSDYTEGWDGKANGVLVMPNTFVYVISYEAPSYVTRTTLKSPVIGDVTVVR